MGIYGDALNHRVKRTYDKKSVTLLTSLLLPYYRIITLLLGQ